jgi:hypothetical protein
MEGGTGVAVVAQVVAHRGSFVVLRHPWGLEVNPWGLGVNQGLPLLSGRCRGPFGARLMSSRHRALGLLNHSALKEPAKLIVDSSTLRGRWLRHRPEEDCCRSDVLAGPG